MEIQKRNKKTNIPHFQESELVLNRDGSVYHLNLLPKNIADTVITVGDPSRVFQVSQHFDKIDFEMNKREFITHTGTYKGLRLTVLSTGIGTDNVEIVMQELDALANINLKTRKVKSRKKRLRIIRVGTSGALQQDVRLGSHIVSQFGLGLDTLMQFYNFQMTEFESQISQQIQEKTGLGFLPYCAEGSPTLLKLIGKDMQEGNTVTCPGFYAPQGRTLRYQLRHPNLLDDLMYFREEGFWLTNFEMETAGYYALGRLLGHEMLSANAIIANRVTKKFSKRPKAVVEDLIVKVLEALTSE